VFWRVSRPKEIALLAVCGIDGALYRTPTGVAVNSAANALTVTALNAQPANERGLMRYLLHLHMERNIAIDRSFLLECVLGGYTFPYEFSHAVATQLAVISAMGMFVPPGATVRGRMTGAVPADGGILTIYALFVDVKVAGHQSDRLLLVGR